jgi:ABC-type amino acid transport system permease subunit
MLKYFELFTEIIGWLKIAASPTLLGLFAALFIYFLNPTKSTLIIAVIVFKLGLIIGIVIATKKFKSSKGTIWFLSRTMATPDLDKKDKE